MRAELDQVIAEYPHSLLCLWVQTNSVDKNADLVEIQHLEELFASLLSLLFSSHSHMVIIITYLNTIILPGVNLSNSIS